VSPLEVVIGLLLALAVFVALTSAVGLYRLPDFFSRIHAAGKTDTLAQQLVVIALVIQSVSDGHLPSVLKLLLISGFLFLTSPASTHAIARAAHMDGLKPWRRPGSPEGEDAAETEPAA
jgi:multicomponent Na+:H+ antiporter subunit G